MLRVQPYYRVSRLDKQRGISIDLQESVCGQFAATQITGDHRVLPALIDRGKSAYTEDWTKRPAFLEMMEAAKRREFDIVLVYMFDRFSRKTLLSLQAIQILLDCGIDIRSATEHIDYNTPYGRKNVRDLASSAEFYSDLLSHRMKDVRAWEAQQGRHVGPIPTGFRRERGVLIPIETIVGPQLAFQCYATQTYSYTQVMEALNAAGYRTNSGKPFTKFQVEEMLKNPVYVGRVRCSGKEYAGAHEGVIAQEVWEAVQRQIERHAAAAGTRHASHPALLSGLARCSNCGEPMWFAPGRGGSYNYYMCRGRARGGREPRCNLGLVTAEVVESHVLASLAVLTSDAEVLQRTADELATLAQQEHEQIRPPADRARVLARMRRIAQIYADDLMSDADYAREIHALKEQLAETPSPVTIAPSVQDAAAMLADLPAALQKAEHALQRALIGEVFTVIYMMPHQVMAARPRAVYAPLLRESRLKIMGWWAGWASTSFPMNFNPNLPPMQIAA